MDHKSGNHLETRGNEYSEKQLKNNWPGTKLGIHGLIVGKTG